MQDEMKNRPNKVFRCGPVQAAIWTNQRDPLIGPDSRLNRPTSEDLVWSVFHFILHGSNLLSGIDRMAGGQVHRRPDRAFSNLGTPKDTASGPIHGWSHDHPAA